MLSMPSMRHSFLFSKWWGLLCSVLIVVCDQGSKLWALQHLAFHQATPIIKGLNFTLTYNYGISFGWLSQGSVWVSGVLIALALGITLLVGVWFFRTPDEKGWERIGLCFVLGGAIGNLIDRGYRGYVVDFIDVYVGTWHWYTFNLADSFICVGGGILAIRIMFFDNKNG